MRIIGLALVTLLAGCVDLSTICPHKPITQGVFGQILDATGANEENVEVDAFGVTGAGTQGNMIGSAETTRGGYEFNLNAFATPGYMICAKSACTTVAVPTGVVEVSGSDTGSSVTWEAPIAVPPEQTIGPCTFGSGD